MPTGTETQVQTFVHKLEEGGWATWIRRAVLWAFVLYVANLWLFKESGFKGLGHEKAIEQAQIAREIARGHGFTTKMIRPAALWQFQSNKGEFPLEVTPDAYHAPLWPVIEAGSFQVANFFRKKLDPELKDPWLMTTKDVVGFHDRIAAAVQLIFYLLAVLVSYFTAKRLFDKRLAVFAAWMLLLCEAFWDFSMSGLPQMLLLFLFSCVAYTMVRAIEAKYAGQRTWPWSIGIGALFGLLALSHGITLFLLLGALVFAVIFFRPWGRDAAIILAVAAVFYVPWLIRNEQVCGNPLGLGWYSGLYQIRGTESQVMRTMALEGPLKGLSPTVFHQKVRGQLIDQLGGLYDYLGHVLVAPLFFIALLHLFKKPEAAVFRWFILSMWIAALLGMAAVGLESIEPYISPMMVKANDIHILFVPVMTFYGLALVLIMWTRLELDLKLVRIGFFTLLFIISGFPFFSQFVELLSVPKGRVHWPPYVPPYIAILGQWTKESEMIMSDMPWAVAWYADRKSLWLPMTMDDFISLNDYNRLGGRLVGLYLTPITGNKPFLHDVAKGEYKDWAPFISRQVNIRDFPLRAVTAMPVDNECVFFADRDRWSARED